MTLPVRKPLDKNCIYINVFSNEYDISDNNADILSDVRSAFFLSGKKQKNKLFLKSHGEHVGYIYMMDQKGRFKWKATRDGNICEQVKYEPAGYCIECKGYTGSFYKKIYFNNSHIWQKTEYFDGYNSEPVSWLLPWLNDDRAAIARYTGETSFPEILFSFNMPEDEKITQQLLKEFTPVLSAKTDKGFSFFGNEEDEKLWDSMIERFKQKIEEDKKDLYTKDKRQAKENILFFDLSALEKTDDESSNGFNIVETTKVFGKKDSAYIDKTQHEKINANDNNTDKPKALTEKKEEKTNSSKPTAIKKKTNRSAITDNVIADKVISLNQREKGLYFGELDVNDNRAGNGRTQTARGQTLYEGEYLDDKKNGFGVGYYKTGRVSYVGNWTDDKQNGFGIEIRPTDGSLIIGRFENNNKKEINAKFDKNGKLVFAGNWNEDSLTGAGVSINSENGNMFIAKWEDGKQLNFGTLIDKNGTLIYYGDYKNDAKDGVGTLYNSDGTIKYSGEFKRDLYSGTGILYTEDKRVIEGEFSSGTVNGKAVERDVKGRIVYDGQWKKGVYSGEGRKYNDNGSYYDGKFVNGEVKGGLSIYDKNGYIIYKGTMLNGEYDGSGVCFENGEKIYDGQLSSGKRSGIGREYKNGQCIYMGSFEDDLYSGFGISYANGVEMYCGMWNNGLFDGQGLLLENGAPSMAGSFKNGLPDGRVNIIKSGKIASECIYTSGVCEYIREYSKDGESLLFEGNVKDGIKEGMGCTFTEYGEKIFEGIFKYGEPFKGMKVITREIPPLEYVPKLKDTEYEKFRLTKEFVIEQPMLGGVYSGSVENGAPHGKGTILFLDHRYTGEFSNGKAHGHGVIYYGDGTVLTGEFFSVPNDNAKEIIFSGVTYYCFENHTGR